MSCYFQVNNQRQKTSGGTAAMCSFLMFGSNSVISHMQWKLKIVQALEFTSESHQQAIEEKDVKIAFLNDDLKNREYQNVCLQDEIKAKDQQIAALQRRYVDYLSDEHKNNGISIIARSSEEEEYLYISICGQHGYRRHKVRVLLTRNQGCTLFADGDTPNATVT